MWLKRALTAYALTILGIDTNLQFVFSGIIILSAQSRSFPLISIPCRQEICYTVSNTLIEVNTL